MSSAEELGLFLGTLGVFGILGVRGALICVNDGDSRRVEVLNRTL